MSNTNCGTCAQPITVNHEQLPGNCSNCVPATTGMPSEIPQPGEPPERYDAATGSTWVYTCLSGWVETNGAICDLPALTDPVCGLEIPVCDGGVDKRLPYTQFVKLNIGLDPATNNPRIFDEKLVVGLNGTTNTGAVVFNEDVQSIDLTPFVVGTNLETLLPCAKTARLFVRTNSSQDYGLTESIIAGDDGLNIVTEAFVKYQDLLVHAKCNVDFHDVDQFARTTYDKNGSYMDIDLNGTNVDFIATLIVAVSQQTPSLVPQTVTAGDSSVLAAVAVSLVGLYI